MKESDLYIALTIYHEACNESTRGKVGIGHVILNRVIRRNLSVKNVIFQPLQFSCYNQGIKPITDPEKFFRCCQAVNLVREERNMGLSFDHATNYHADYMDPFPSWIKNMRRIGKVGLHIFYEE